MQRIFFYNIHNIYFSDQFYKNDSFPIGENHLCQYFNLWRKKILAWILS